MSNGRFPILIGPRRTIIVMAMVALVAGACTAAAPAGSSPAATATPAALPSASTTPSADPSALILRATQEGGFISPSALRTRMPIVSVFADGRIMSVGATPAIYPGPLLPSIVFRSVGPAGAAGILKAAEDAGLAHGDATYGPGPVPDGATTVITVVHDGSQTISRFGSLEVQPVSSGSGTPDDQVRAAAADLLTRLMGSDTFGGTAGAEGPYEPLGFQLFVSPGAPAPADADLGRPPLSWPLATPLASFGRSDELGGSGARVGVVVGAEAAALGPILASASEITPFTSGGQSWTIVVKPLLPDEVAAIGG